MARPALGLIETRGLTGALGATHAATTSGQVVIASLEQTSPGVFTVRFEGEWHTVQAAVEAGARAAHDAGELISMHVIPRTDDGLVPMLPYGRFVSKYSEEQSRAGIKKTRETAAKPGGSARPIRPRRRKHDTTGVQSSRSLPESSKEPESVEPETSSAVVEREPQKPAPSPSSEPAAAPPQPQTTTSRPEAPAVQSTVDQPGLLSREQLESMPVVKLRKYARSIEGLPIQGRQISKANKETLLEAIDSVRR
jgi:ethanolamine utilization protein EutM